MKQPYKEEALLFLDSEHYAYFVSKGFDDQRLKLEDPSLKKVQDTSNLIISFHGSYDGNLFIGSGSYHPVDIIQASRSNVRDADGNTKCFDIFACHIGIGIRSSNELRQWLEDKYKNDLLVGEYIILNGGNKTTNTALNRKEIARTIKEGDDKCPPYIRVLRRMCHSPETIKFLYVVKEINPKTKELENKLVTHKFSALKLTTPNVVTIDKIRAHLLDSMEQFKNEFLSHIDDEEEKSQIDSTIEKEIGRLKQEVLSKDDHLVTYGNKTIFIEVNRGKIDRVKTYLRSKNKFDVNLSIDNESTPLSIVSYNGNEQIVTLLLNAGANPNLADKDGVTPLCIASQEGHTKVVEILLKNKADLNLCKKNGVTPLYMASQEGHTKVVELLLKNGADPNLYKKNGVTPLFMASQEGHTKVVELLLKNEADPNLADKDRLTPLYMASQEGHTKIVELLLSNKAQPNLSNKYGETPLYLASQNGCTKVVEILLSKGARPNLCRGDRTTPLFMVSQMGHTKVVELLLNKGANPNLSRDDSATPIVVAIFMQHTEIVKILLPKVNLGVCKWQGQDVEELIKSKIKNEEKKEELLEVLYSQTNKVLEPKRDKLHGKRKRLDYDEELPHTKRKKPSSIGEKIPSTKASSHTGEQLDREEQMEH